MANSVFGPIETFPNAWNIGTLCREPMLQPSGGGTGGSGDASAANQTTEIAKLTSIDGKLTGPLAVSDNGGSLTVDGSVSVSNFPATQPVSAASLPLPTGAATETTLSTMSGKLPASVGQKAMAASLPVVLASDQGAIPTTKQPTGGTNVLKTGTLTTTTTTADQVVLTYTVTALKTFYLTYVVMYGRLTTLSATASILGTISLETPSGTKTITFDDVNCTTSEIGFQPLVFSEPIPIAAGTVVRVVVTPAAVTSTLWRANFGGYEK